MSWTGESEEGMSDGLRDSGKRKSKEEAKYPCRECGKLRTKAEGGTVFTVCDRCWDKKHPSEKVL